MRDFAFFGLFLAGPALNAARASQPGDWMRLLMLTLALLSLPALATDPAPHDGSVKLEVSISPEGTVTDARVLKSDMPPEFDQKAIDITKKFKYKPKKKNGEAVPAKGIQVIKFRKGDK